MIEKPKNYLQKNYIWFNKPQWLNRLTLYFILFLFVFSISDFVFSDKNLLHTDVDSARYMLSALIQSEAAIIAIVVTLSIVSVQLASSSYSTRLIEIFKKSPDLWILLLIYGSAIFWGLGVLKLIERGNPQINSLSNLENCIIFSYYFGFFAFAALVPYTWNTFYLLEPTTVIEILSKKITKLNTSSVKNGYRTNLNENPNQPIIDIINASLRNDDYETSRKGLRVIADNTDSLLNIPLFCWDKIPGCDNVNLIDYLKYNYDFKGEKIEKIIIIDGKLELKISNDVNYEFIVKEKDGNLYIYDYEIILTFFFTDFRRIGLISANKMIGPPVFFVINYMRKKGEFAADNKLTSATWWAVYSIGLIASELIEKSRLLISILNSLEALENIGIIACENKLENAFWWTAYYLEIIGIKAIEKKLEIHALKTVISLEKIGITMAKQEYTKENECIMWYILKLLDNIKKEADEQGLMQISEKAISSIKKIQEKYPHEKPPNIDQEIVNTSLKKMLESIEKFTSIQMFDPAFRN